MDVKIHRQVDRLARREHLLLAVSRQTATFRKWVKSNLISASSFYKTPATPVLVPCPRSLRPREIEQGGFRGARQGKPPHTEKEILQAQLDHPNTLPDDVFTIAFLLSLRSDWLEPDAPVIVESPQLKQ